MAKKKAQPKSPFLGYWRIVSMSNWDEDYINEEVPAFIDFEKNGKGDFQFAYVRGEIDYRLTTRGDEPAIEWSWAGNDDQEDLSGRGWAMLDEGQLRGSIFIHSGDESEFVAAPPEATKGK